MATKKKARKKTAPRKHPKETEIQGTCFIIMPFGDWFDTYYETIYLPAIEAAGLTPRRADNLYRPSAIINDIWALTNEAKLILADLSEKNANVFYELGMAHALAKPAILVTESMEDVPFDLRLLRVIVYEKNRPDWGDALRKKIKLAIKEVLASPLDAVLPTFIQVKESNTQPSASKVEREVISLRQDMDRLTRELRFTSAGPEAPSIALSTSINPSVTNSRSTGSSRFLEIGRRELDRGKSESEVTRFLNLMYGLSPNLAWAITKEAAKLVSPREIKPGDSLGDVKASEKTEPTSAKE